MGEKHTQLPHELGINSNTNLKPVDKVVYVYMKSFTNKDGYTYVSIDKLADECELNWRTVSDSVARLQDANEIKIVTDENKVAKGSRSKTYQILNYDRKFEKISQECLDYLKNGNFSTNEKCVIICTHEYSWKFEEYGELTDTLDELAEKIHMPVRTFKRTISDLMKRGIILKTYNNKNQLVRRVQWDKIMMQMIYQVKKNTEDIEKLKQKNEFLENKIAELEEKINKSTNI